MTEEEVRRECEYITEKVMRYFKSSYDNLVMRLTGENILPTPVYLDDPHIFIGSKPIKLYIGSEEYAVSKWSEVTYILLSEVSKAHYDEIRTLADKYRGKCRVILGSSGMGMDNPIRIAEDLYFEGHFGVEATITHLLRICEYTGFDTRKILVSIRERKENL